MNYSTQQETRQEVVMYEQVFNLTSRPFTSAPYTKHYFPAARIQQAIDVCRMSISRASGPAIVVGGHGTGKSLMLALLAEEFHSQFRVVNLSVSHLETRADLLQSILFETQQSYRGMTESEMRLALIEYVKTSDACGGGLLLLVDDGQKLSRETVEELQLLTNFIRDGQPRVRLVLAGSNAMEERLVDPKLESFNQRVSGRCYLSCLSRDETEAYVKAHIERAAGDPAELFHEESYRAIHECTEGRPRYINQVCDHAMIFAATRGLNQITDSLVREAWFDVQQLPGCYMPECADTAESPPNNSVKIEETEGWTVLEFGQLDDEASVAESTGDSTAEMVEPDAAVQQEQPQQFQPESATPTMEAPSETVSSPEFTSPVAELPLENFSVEQPSPPVEDNAISNGLGLNSFLTSTPEPEADPFAASARAAASAKSEAVPEREPEPEPVEHESQLPTAEGAAAILAAAMVGFVDDGDAASDVENRENVVELQTEQPVCQQEIDSQIEEFNASQLAIPPLSSSMVHATDDMPPVESSVHEKPQRPVVEIESTSPELQEISVAAEQAASVEMQIEQAPETAPPVPAKVSAAPVCDDPVCDDPFGNDLFDDEEVLTDAYAPFIAVQNQRSLEVTSENLRDLSPQADGVLDAIAADDPIQPASPPSTFSQSTEPQQQKGQDEQEEVFPTFPSAMTPEFVREPIKDQPELQNPLESRQGESRQEQANAAMGMPSAQYAPASNIVPLDPEQESLAAPLVSQQSIASLDSPQVDSIEDASTTSSPPQLVTPLQALADAAAITPPEKVGTGFHEQTGSPEDPEIRRQAEEIIRSLNNAASVEAGGTLDDIAESQTESVSHETSESLTPTQETSAIENMIQQSVAQHDSGANRGPSNLPAIVMPSNDPSPEALEQAAFHQNETPVENAGSAQPTEPSRIKQWAQAPLQTPAQNQPALPLTPRGFSSDRLENRDSTSTETEMEIDEPDVRILDELRGQSGLLSPSQPQPQSPEKPHTDDQDILNIRKQIQPFVPQQENQEEPLPQYSQQEPSTGEAARIDYQKLFDQLRSIDQD